MVSSELFSLVLAVTYEPRLAIGALPSTPFASRCAPACRRRFPPEAALPGATVAPVAVSLPEKISKGRRPSAPHTMALGFIPGSAYGQNHASSFRLSCITGNNVFSGFPTTAFTPSERYGVHPIERTDHTVASAVPPSSFPRGRLRFFERNFDVDRSF